MSIGFAGTSASNVIQSYTRMSVISDPISTGSLSWQSLTASLYMFQTQWYFKYNDTCSEHLPAALCLLAMFVGNTQEEKKSLCLVTFCDLGICSDSANGRPCASPVLTRTCAAFLIVSVYNSR